MVFLFMTLLLLQQLLYCFPSPLISLLHSRVSLTLTKAGVHPGCKVYSVNPAALDVFKPAGRLFSNFKLFTQSYQLYPCQGRWTAIKVPRRLLDLFKLCSPLIFKLFIKTSPHQETRIPSIFSTTVLHPSEITLHQNCHPNLSTLPLARQVDKVLKSIAHLFPIKLHFTYFGFHPCQI